MFAVIGITGNTGAAVAETLLRAGKGVRALVRDAGRASRWTARGVELVEGDAEDAGALRRLFDGAEGAYVMVPPSVTHPDPLAHYEAVGRAAAAAARATGIGRVVLLSSEGAHLPDGTGPIVGLHRAEAALRGAARHVTFLRATYFQENWAGLLPLAEAQGVLPTMLASVDGKRAMVAAADIGHVAAELLLEASPPEVVELSGPEPTSPRDVAEAMGAALGRAVAPVQPPHEAWEGILTGAGVGPAYSRLLVEMYDGINAGHVRFSGDADARRGRIGIAENVAGWVRAKVAA
ncbi:NmrA family NAD(P)-binding protein [Roseomonas sp. CCTCC AB2023176]|uniref:NmrA family NAD(P)-binding protein n=1 Tax=Roseomonas sp. CCTCC AB2023176 TaxID=3342640 RepID=UPI0035D644E2